MNGKSLQDILYVVSKVIGFRQKSVGFHPGSFPIAPGFFRRFVYAKWKEKMPRLWGVFKRLFKILSGMWV